jgi:phosphate transport system permease protein
MKEKIAKNLCFMVAFVTISITLFIIVVLSFGAKNFFASVPLFNFLFGSVWSPESAAVSNLADKSFGILPLLSGTLLISFISLVFAIPVGIFTAIYISQYASKKARFFIKPFMEIIAGIPSIVFGYLAAVFLSPVIKKISILMA